MFNSYLSLPAFTHSPFIPSNNSLLETFIKQIWFINCLFEYILRYEYYK